MVVFELSITHLVYMVIFTSIQWCKPNKIVFRQFFQVFHNFWENRFFSGHAVFTELKPLLASNCMQKIREIWWSKLEITNKPCFRSRIGPDFRPRFSGWRSGNIKNLIRTFSKDEPSSFPKIKTDFDLLYLLPRYTRLKKGTISPFLPLFGPITLDHFFFWHAVFGKIKPLLASNYIQKSKKK